MSWKNEILIHILIIHLAVWGTFGRIGLQKLTSYDGSVTYSALWANFAACLVLGLLSKFTKTPLIVGLSTGFCGSLSSFSSLILELFYLAANVPEGEAYDYPNAGYGVMLFLSGLLIEMGVSIFGFILGKHIAYKHRIIEKNHEIFSYILAGLGIAVFIVVIVLIGVKPGWRVWFFLALFAMVGALVRYHLSKFNRPQYPLGTFLANLIGTTLISVFVLLARGISSSQNGLLYSDIIDCQVLLGLENGLCGGMTTISTFVSELFTFKKTSDLYIYGIGSIAICFALMVIILGSYTWTLGLGPSLCSL